MGKSLSFSIALHLALGLICGVYLRQRKLENRKAVPLIVELVKPAPVPSQNRVVQTTLSEKVAKAKPHSLLGLQNQIVDRETVSRSKMIQVGHSGSSPHLPQLKALGLGIIPNPQKADKLLSKDNSPKWATPGVRTEDFVEGMKESDRTALNTQEFIFYGYFQRIRERLEQAWVPILKGRMAKYYKSGRRMASDTQHTTKVIVTLNRQGEITRVQMLSESGILDLDEAAVSAFNSAGPFPNPPKGIVDSNNEIHIPWDFVLKT